MAARIPKLVKGVAGVDLRALPLAPVDGFILSRIDGTMSAPEIAAGTGLPQTTVLATLAKLEGLGLVEPESAAPKQLSKAPSASPTAGRSISRPASTPAQITVSSQRASGTVPAVTAPIAPTATAAAPSPPPQPQLLSGPSDVGYDPRELDEDVELEMPQRRKVLDLYYKLEDLNYYALLGVPRASDKKAIKRAYFEMASLFHPDKFFRKRLGSFKPKMEAIFGRITEAHDVLTSKQQRPEYDAYVSAKEQSRGIESLMESAMAEVERASEQLKREVRPSSPPPPSSPRSPVPSRPPLPPADAQALRDALARRLTGGGPPRVNSMRPTPPATKTSGLHFASAQDAVDALKRRYEDRLSDAHGSQAKKYADAARASAAKNDMVTAATNYRVALSFTPNDGELRAAFDKAQAQADQILGDSYLKQAEYEERSEHWVDAAKSWARFARSRPSEAKAHERHANALLKGGGNLHEAAAAAKRAVALVDCTEFKITLANVYVAAGLTLNAKRELEAALQIEPGNAHLQAFLKRLQKAG